MNIKPLPKDYVGLIKKYDSLSNGEQASIRREVEADDLRTNPVFYRLIQDTVFATNSISQAARLVYFLPFVHHKEGAKSFGALLYKLFEAKKIKDRRLFLVIRSEYPQDLIQLRRLLQQLLQLKPNATIDYTVFGDMLFHWGKTKEKSESSKRRLMQDFYLSAPPQTQDIKED